MQVVVSFYHVLLGATLRGFLRIWMSAKQNALKAIPRNTALFGNGITKKCKLMYILGVVQEQCSLGRGGRGIPPKTTYKIDPIQQIRQYKREGFSREGVEIQSKYSLWICSSTLSTNTFLRYLRYEGIIGLKSQAKSLITSVHNFISPPDFLQKSWQS